MSKQETNKTNYVNPTVQAIAAQYAIGGNSAKILKLKLRIILVTWFTQSEHTEMDAKARREICEFQRANNIMADATDPLFYSKSALSRIPAIEKYLLTDDGRQMLNMLAAVESTVGSHNTELCNQLKELGLPHTSTALGLAASKKSESGNGGRNSGPTNVTSTDTNAPDKATYETDHKSFLAMIKLTVGKIGTEDILEVLNGIQTIVDDERAARSKTKTKTKKKAA